MSKAHQDRSTFGSWDVEIVYAVVARSTFPSQNVQSTPCSGQFWKLRCRKSARRCGAKHVSKSKSTKHTRCGALLEVEMSKKCTPLRREAHFQVKTQKTPHARTTFEGTDVVLRGKRKGLCTLPKVSKMWGFCSNSKNNGRRGTFEDDLEKCISRGKRSTRVMFIRDVRRSGRWFPEKGCILEHQIFRFAKMFLRDRCRTSCDLASLLRGRRSTLDRWSGKTQNVLVRGRRNYNCNYTSLDYTITTTPIQLQLQLRCTTLHPAVVGEVTTATIATTPRNTTPTTFRSISGFALPSIHRSNSPPL